MPESESPPPTQSELPALSSLAFYALDILDSVIEEVRPFLRWLKKRRRETAKPGYVRMPHRFIALRQRKWIKALDWGIAVGGAPRSVEWLGRARKKFRKAGVAGVLDRQNKSSAVRAAVARAMLGGHIYSSAHEAAISECDTLAVMVLDAVDEQPSLGAAWEVVAEEYPLYFARDENELENEFERIRVLLEYESANMLDAQAAIPSDFRVTAEKVSCDTAMKRAEKHCERNPFPGVNALAKIVHCSPATIRKAIDRSNELRSMLAGREARRASVSTRMMADAVMESVRQSREPDPADAAAVSTDDLFHRLIEQATPTERAKLNAMTPGQRRELVATIHHDPDR